MVFNPQFSALAAYSSIGLGDYHAMQWTVRKRFSGGLLFDLNYTWSKSIDLGSTGEAGTSWNPTTSSFSGFIQNTWNASQMRGVSSYDTTHSVNAYMVYQLPFGRGRKFGNSMNRVLDAFVGGWQISGTYRQTSGLPFSMGNGQRWPTNWEVSDIATPNGDPDPGRRQHREFERRIAESVAGSESRFRVFPGNHGRPVRKPQYDAREWFLRHRHGALQELHDAVFGAP